MNGSAVGLGTWQFSGGVGALGSHFKALSSEIMYKVVKASLDHGITWFDTAEAYGDGQSEKNLAAALNRCGVTPGSIQIATKWWPKQRKAVHMLESIDQRLKCLDPYPIDLYQIHWPESKSWFSTELKTLEKLYNDQKIGAAGLCNYSAKRMKQAQRYFEKRGVPFLSNQVRYSLLFRHIETNGILETAKALGLKVIAWSPLEQGMLTGRFHQKPDWSEVSKGRIEMFGINAERIKRTQPLIDTLQTVASEHSAKVSQIALAWLTQFHGDTVNVIPGASNQDQAMTNAEAMRVELSQEELDQIDQVSKEVC